MSHKNAPKIVNWSERNVVRVRLESHTFSNQQVRQNKDFPKTKSMRGILGKAQYAFFGLLTGAIFLLMCCLVVFFIWYKSNKMHDEMLKMEEEMLTV